MRKVILSEKFEKFAEHWSPKIVGEVNDAYVKLVKLQGEFVWHHHEAEDELFFVLQGVMWMKYREPLREEAAEHPERREGVAPRYEEKEERVGPGEFIVIPRGLEHCPVADEEVHLMLLEPKTTLNTGNVQNERTVPVLERL